MKTLNIHEVTTQLSAVLAEVEKTGEPILICRDGHPVADLVPHHKRERLCPHSVMSRIKIKYDPTEPLTPDEWPVESN
ncbi:MAG: type II toxin-antitoxin system prevent-host-death family antitoxin [Lentisphaerae bacterium]|nr:type II toxin-antitoxin system prevent-host-death family antitoxin [Lentisphaerota bacterium]